MEAEVDARVYRERAVQARLGAKEATRPDFRAVFERLAESYEEKARNAARMPRDTPKLSSNQ
jgi:hypothetical protein